MGKEGWRMAVKLCDSCKTSSASLFCRADSAFLCVGCDGKVHAANKLASRHARVLMCEVCEQAPASVTCKADAAALCVKCDRDIHSANPLARRHERFPVVPFYDSATSAAKSAGGDDHYFEGGAAAGSEAEEAEAASWLLANPNPKIMDSPDYNLKEEEYLFNNVDPYLDIDLALGDEKPNQLQLHHYQQQRHSSRTDGVVPVQSKSSSYRPPQPQITNVVDGFPAYDIDYAGSKPFMYNFSTQSISQSVSSSSMEVGVVPDNNVMADVVSNSLGQNVEMFPNLVSGIDREARVLRYREKRKNRKFEKTIRYASRKAYAETRPRIKGRFAKRSEIQVDDFITPDANANADAEADASYGVVPSYTY